MALNVWVEERSRDVRGGRKRLGVGVECTGSTSLPSPPWPSEPLGGGVAFSNSTLVLDCTFIPAGELVNLYLLG